MDERILQLKDLKKCYKRMRARAGWGWKVFAWLFFLVFFVVTAATLFVVYNHTAPVQFLDNSIWEPAKAALGLKIDYAWFWCLLKKYGLIASVCSGALWLLFWGLGHSASCAMKNTDTYRSWRTLKLTLDTEKEEKK